MVKSTDTGISQRTNVYAEGKMLSHAMPVQILDKFGLTRPMPKNKGINISFRRFVPFTAATTPLTEGVTPTEDTFDFEDVPGTLAQYGQVVSVTDVIEDTHEDPVLNEVSEGLGENIGRTMEKLRWAVLQGGTSVFYPGSVTARADVNATITRDKQRKITRYLKAQKAMKISKVLTSTPDYGTESVEAAFVAVAHTDMESDIRNMTGFVSAADYGQRKLLCPEEIGSVEDVRYILSPDLTPIMAGGAAVGATGMVAADDTNIDVYPILYFGKEAYGTVPLRGEGSVDPSIIPAGQKTKDDPLGQRGYAGWKAWHLTKILNDSWMARFEGGVTDL